MTTKEQVSIQDAREFREEKNAFFEEVIASTKEQQRDALAARYKPVLSIKESIERYDQIKEYVAKAMIEGEDFGKVPGVDKPFLFQAGAQKLCVLFGYVPHFEAEKEIEDWDGSKYGEPLFYYRFRCIMQRDGAAVGEGIGSASSWESKYRYRWVGLDDVPQRYQVALKAGELKMRDGTIRERSFAIDKAETSGKYGKPKDYWDKWQAAIASGEATPIKMPRNGSQTKDDGYEMRAAMYRIPNPDFADVINTTQKMGTKRALLAATIAATGLSGLFTQDEDSGAIVPEPEPIRRETRQQAPPPDEDLELRAMWEALDKNPKNIKACLDELSARIIIQHGDPGLAVYNGIVRKFRERFPKDNGKETANKGDFKQLLGELWEAAKMLDREKKQKAEHDQSAPVDGDVWPEGKE